MNKRRYDDACAAAHALELVGERWALLVVRELVLGPKRFTDLRRDLPGISPNVLTQRLEELEAGLVVRRRKLPPPASVWVYELTDWGQQLDPILRDLGRWAAQSPAHRPDQQISVNSFILSLRAMFSPEQAGDANLEIELRLQGRFFGVTVRNGQIDAQPWAGRSAPTVMSGAPAMLASVIYGGRPLDEAIAAGDVSVYGDRAAADTFIILFPLPARVTASEQV